MTAITIVDLTNAKLDVDHIAKIATSSDLNAVDRIGNTKRTIAGIDAAINLAADGILAASKAQAATALAILNDFRGRWYGALSSDPTVDPLGAAVNDGDLYFNSTSNVMKVYRTSAWINYEVTAVAAAATATEQVSLAVNQVALATTQANTSGTQAGISTAQAGISTAQAALSANAKTSAEAARDAAIIQSGVYATEALGRAAVADGAAFKVQGIGDVAAYEYRRTNSTTSVLLATYPSSSFVSGINVALNADENLTLIKSGNLNSANAIVVAISGSSFTFNQVRSLSNVVLISSKQVFTYNTNQNTVFWYVKNVDLTYTLVGSQYIQGDFTLVPANFFSGATHYIISGVTTISPNMAVTEYKKQTSSVDFKLYPITSQQANIEAEKVGNYILPSILDTKKFKINTSLNIYDGSEYYQSGPSYNTSDFCEVQLNTTYYVSYIIALNLFDAQRNYLGNRNIDIINNNTNFTITNPSCKYVRISTPSVDTNCSISDYKVASPFGYIFPKYSGVKKQALKNIYSYPIQGFGDSIIARHIDFTGVTDRQSTMFTYGGCISSLIRDQFLSIATTQNAINFIYIGHNNITETQNILNDVRKMVRSLPHQRFLIASTPSGNYSTLQGTLDFVANCKKLESKLQSTYGNHYLNMRDAAVNGGYDMGDVRLTASFTQPVADGTTTVNIYVDKVSFMVFNNTGDGLPWIPNNNLIKIGFSGVYDEYQIVSSTIVSGDAGYLTCKLVTNASYNTPIGGSVGNINTSATPTGASTPINFIKYLEVVKSNDLYMLSIGTTASTFREDGVHPSIYGGKCTAEMIAYRLATLNF